MKILLVSDLHANIEAVQALAEDHDELWVLGDLVDYGPDPAAVIDFVRQRASVVVRGNHDHAVGYGVAPRCSASFRRMAEATWEWTKRTLSESDLSYLRELPVTERVTRQGRRYYLCHAAPSGPLHTYLAPDAPEWDDELTGVDADLVLVGHTHVPFVRACRDRVVVNPGSLGQPKHGSPTASYAMIEDGAVHLRTVTYRVSDTAAKIRRLPLSVDVSEGLTRVLESGGELP